MNPSIAQTNGSGRALSTYNSIASDGSLCQGSVTITATASGASATATLAVAAPTTGVVNFVSAEPKQIYLSTSGASSQSILTFKVLSSGVAQAALPVKLTLVSHPGGVSFGTLNNIGPKTINSDAAGLVKVTVFAGGTPGPVTIKAEWDADSTIYTTSNNFTIAQGPVQQGRLSLAADKHNIEGDSVDGQLVNITASAADANGNPAPAGTVINFVAQGGQIGSSCTTTINSGGLSQCTVSFISQSPRPVSGRVNILAYLEGIKWYTDNNSNNQFDSGDVAVDQGDAYRDDNEDGAYTTGEFVVSRGGTVPCAGYGGDGPSKLNTCTGTNVGATTVRTQITLLFSPSTPTMVVASPPINQLTYTNTGTTSLFQFTLNGLNVRGGASLLPMPQGTTVKVNSLRTGCTASDLAPITVPNRGATTGSPLSNLGSIHTIFLIGTPGVPATGTPPSVPIPAIVCSGATIRVTTTTPFGLEYTSDMIVP